MEGHRQGAGGEAFPEQVNLIGSIFHQQDLWWGALLSRWREAAPVTCRGHASIFHRAWQNKEGAHTSGTAVKMSALRSGSSYIRDAPFLWCGQASLRQSANRAANTPLFAGITHPLAERA